LASVALAIVTMALVVVAAVIAFRPFGVDVELGNQVSTSGTCDSAATSAWHDGSKDGLALWAVTVGTNMMGDTPVFGKNVKYVLLGKQEMAWPGPYCVGEARHRLMWSGTILMAGLAVMTVAVYRLRRRAYVLR
jgi:hypothetical protein